MSWFWRISDEPHFTLANFVAWWTIGTILFPVALGLSITNPFGYESHKLE
jgi:hypothetical protein